jgi:hypothetical protein
MILEYEKAIFEYLRVSVPTLQRLTYADEEELLYIQGNLSLHTAYYSRRTEEWPLPKLISIMDDLGPNDDPIRGSMRKIDYYLRVVDYTLIFFEEREAEAQRLANRLRFYFSDVPYVIAHYDIGEELQVLQDQEFKIQLTGVRVETVRSHKEDKGALRKITVNWRSWIPMRRTPIQTVTLYRGFILSVNGEPVIWYPEDLIEVEKPESPPESLLQYNITYQDRICHRAPSAQRLTKTTHSGYTILPVYPKGINNIYVINAFFKKDNQAYWLSIMSPTDQPTALGIMSPRLVYYENNIIHVVTDTASYVLDAYGTPTYEYAVPGGMIGVAYYNGKNYLYGTTGVWSTTTQSHVLSGDTTHCAIIEGGLWCFTENGVFRYTSSNLDLVMSYFVMTNLYSTPLVSFVSDGGRTYLLDTAAFSRSELLDKPMTGAIYHTHSNTVYIATHSGLYLYADEKVTLVPGTAGMDIRFVEQSWENFTIMPFTDSKGSGILQLQPNYSTVLNIMRTDSEGYPIPVYTGLGFNYITDGMTMYYLKTFTSYNDGDAIPNEILVEGPDGFTETVYIPINKYAEDIDWSGYAYLPKADIQARITEVLNKIKEVYPGEYTETNEAIIQDTVLCPLPSFGILPSSP